MSIFNFICRIFACIFWRQLPPKPPVKKVTVVSICTWEGLRVPRYVVDAHIEQVRQLLEGTYLPLIDSSEPLDRKWLRQLVSEYLLGDQNLRNLMEKEGLSLLDLSTFTQIVKRESDEKLQRKARDQALFLKHNHPGPPT